MIKIYPRLTPEDLGEMITVYSYDPRVMAMKNTYRELFGEDCVLKWHLVVVP
jgi:hypothetical protein